jgi:hypothetical protein
MRPNFSKVFLLAIGLGIVLVAIAGLASFELCAASGLMLGMGYLLTDTLTRVTKALPNGANTITTDGIDLGHGTRGDFLANCELKVTVPALSTTELPDTQTVTYSVEHDDAANFGTVSTLFASIAVQTGAGGAGAAGSTPTFRLPVDVKRYIRVKAVKTGAANASTSSVVAELVF